MFLCVPHSDYIKKKIKKSVLKRKALKARKMIIHKMRLFFAVREPST